MIREAFAISAIIFEKPGYVHAQCLELDVICSAKSRHEIWRSVAEHVAINVSIAREMGYAIPQAKPIYWNAFSRGSTIYMPRAENVVYQDQEFFVRPNAVRFLPYTALRAA